MAIQACISEIHLFRADNAKARPATAAAAAPAPLPVSRPPSPEIPPMPPFPGETDNNVQQGERDGSNSVFPPQLHPPARTHASMPSTRLSMMHTPPGEDLWIELCAVQHPHNILLVSGIQSGVKPMPPRRRKRSQRRRGERCLIQIR